jgi:pimeloyl-ACP methyl ester carboxylesterase
VTIRRLLAAAAVSGALASCASDAGVSETSSEPTGATATTAPSEPTAPTSTEPVTTDGSATTEPPEPASYEIAWEEYDDGLEIGTIEVPVDYDDPDGDTFELFLGRSLAQDPENRIGTLLVNPGGPGFSGAEYGLFASSIFDQDLLDRFDIIGWDPRGTGQSVPAIDCVDDYDRYYAQPDITPDDTAEREQNVALAEEFAAACVEALGETFAHVGTNDVARDMDAIRQALGEEEISYFGFSYGSELGATWATLFPETVRAAVLDGAADPNADSTEASIQQLRGFESSLATFLAECSATEECEFHNGGDAEGAFDALMQSLDDAPIPSEPGRADTNRTVAINGVIQAMYSEAFWPALERALADAQEGDGAGLLALHDSYFQRQPDGTYGDELEAFQVISCADNPERKTVEDADAEAPLYTEAAPRLAPAGSTGSYFCTFLPEAQDPRVEITGAGAGPIVVIGTTGDPATPLDSTRAMAAALEDGRLVIVEADQHTGYGVNRCVNDVVRDYLVDLIVPEDGTECR